jgi:hypothetical protein
MRLSRIAGKAWDCTASESRTIDPRRITLDCCKIRGSVYTGRDVGAADRPYTTIKTTGEALMRLKFRKLLILMLSVMWLLPAAAQESENVGTLVKITPEDGHNEELIEAITEYHKWIAEKARCGTTGTAC